MLKIEEIMKILPHRYPFLLIDRVISYEVNQSARALKLVSMNEWYFQGHFPEKPVLPGVLQIEALAQTGAIALLAENPGMLAYLAGVDKARFKKPVVPGDEMELFVEISQRKGRIGKGVGEIRVNGEMVMSAELLFALES